ncbi:MAG: hypothetical protein RL754_245 [Bacteroidota bacterium]|jgi:hypothetical protein
MLKTSEKKELQIRLDEVLNSISLLESTHPDHPALYHLRSERKWMEQRLKKTFWYQVKWKIQSFRGVLRMSTVGFRLWFQSSVMQNQLKRLPFFIVLIALTNLVILYQGRLLFHWDLFPNSDSPIDEWIIGN